MEVNDKFKQMHALEKFFKLSVETEETFKYISRRVPLIGPEELHRFVDIPKEYCDETQTAMVDKLLASPSASHFSPFLFTGDGPYLRRNTWLNDAIVQCYTAVLNSITEVAKRCIFLGPIISHG